MALHSALKYVCLVFSYGTVFYQSMVAHSYHSKFAKDFAKKPSKINRYFNENVKQKISNT